MSKKNTVRTKLIKEAKALNVEFNKFWNTNKLAEAVKNAKVSLPKHKSANKELVQIVSNRRKEANIRAWQKRRALFGPSGFKAGHGPKTATV